MPPLVRKCWSPFFEWSDLDLTSSLKFLKAATLSSTLSWLRGRSFKRSITWQRNAERDDINRGALYTHYHSDTVINKELYSRRRLCRRALRGTHQRTLSGLTAGRKYCQQTSLLLCLESDTCRGKRIQSSIYTMLLIRLDSVCVCVCVSLPLSNCHCSVF